MSDTSFILRLFESSASYIRNSSPLILSLILSVISFFTITVSLSRRKVEGTAAFNISPRVVK